MEKQMADLKKMAEEISSKKFAASQVLA